MTIDEAFQRIVRGHWLVILLCPLVAVAASLVLSSRSPALYEALGRVQMGNELASSNVQADATSGRALGIATSPGVVRTALEKAQLAADAVRFAKDHIDVRRVGVSPVLEIVVSASSPQHAAVMATSITADVLRFSNQTDRQAMTERQADLKEQISELTRQRQALIPRLTKASPGDVLAIQAQLAALMSTQNDYERQLSELDLAAASAPRAILLDSVVVPTAPVPSDAAQKGVLAGLIGLLLGLGIASVTEAVRPRLRTPEAVAQALDLPHLGHVSARTNRMASTAAGVIADRIALLGRRFEVVRVFLVPVRDVDEAFAGVVAADLGPGGPGSWHRFYCEVLSRTWVEPGLNPAGVVLAPQIVRPAELQRTVGLLAALGWPVLGVITYDPKRLPRLFGPTGSESTSIDEPGVPARDPAQEPRLADAVTAVHAPTGSTSPAAETTDASAQEEPIAGATPAPETPSVLTVRTNSNAARSAPAKGDQRKTTPYPAQHEVGTHAATADEFAADEVAADEVAADEVAADEVAADPREPVSHR